MPDDALTEWLENLSATLADPTPEQVEIILLALVEYCLEQGLPIPPPATLH
jgi:hypothetical protein